MADSDYTTRGSGALTTVARLTAGVTQLQTVVPIYALQETAPDSITVGMAALIDDEIVRIDAFSDVSVTIARGCADTIPAQHALDAPIWFFGMEVGTDNREYVATETVGVKVLPYTPNNTAMAIGDVPPRSLTFNSRFSRPYPPGEFKCKGVYWFTALQTMALGETSLVWTWNHRDRIVQADQLIDHNDGDIGPESGTTYTARIYDAANTLKRTVSGITGKTWSYSRTLAAADLAGAGDGYVLFTSVRDGLDSIQPYRTNIHIAFGGLGEALGESLGGN